MTTAPSLRRAIWILPSEWLVRSFYRLQGGKVLLLRVFASIAIVALSGCANLAGIQNFGKLSSEVAAYSKLTNDYAAGPRDSQKYTLSSEDQQRKVLATQATLRAKQVAKLRLLLLTPTEN